MLFLVMQFIEKGSYKIVQKYQRTQEKYIKNGIIHEQIIKKVVFVSVRHFKIQLLTLWYIVFVQITFKKLLEKFSFLFYIK